ncbi:MAG: glycerol-3-phosphate dehydrogenase [Pacificimonas sp.]|jgi:glycerol-3-phosphate dehydrogenase|nr:glycerol-3-phosphate dehydrogenase [Pacificimonas sp.]
MPQPFDLLIIGAGINGAGLARDAAGRGKSVILVEKGDLGGGTSAASTKLIHGGLRYLEFYEFGLVRKALKERETILSIAPHLAWPMPFLLPLSRDTRPGWMIRAGLFVYDHLARRRSFPNAERVDLRRDPAGAPLKPSFENAFRYWDGWVDDSRLVVANCRDAERLGAEIVVRNGAASARFDGTLWHVTLDDGREVSARQIVNCAGPWAEEVARGVLGRNDAPRLDLVQGAHIIVPRIGSAPDAFMLQQPDGRIVFMIPYQNDFTMIGTTETRIETPADAAITPEEKGYLLAAANRFLDTPLTEDDIVASFAGTRPLVLEEGKDARETTRDWKLRDHQGVPAMTVIGGKLTTYRVLAEAIMDRLYPNSAHWTATKPLPGGDIPNPGHLPPRKAYEDWLSALQACFADLPASRIADIAARFGTETEAILSGERGRDFGCLFEAEIDMMKTREWAKSAEDILWRRSKCGLRASDELRSFLNQS